MRARGHSRIVRLVWSSLLATIFACQAANCLNGNSSLDRVFVVKPLSGGSTQSYGSPKVKETFKELFDKVTVQVKENTPIGTKITDVQAGDPAAPNAKILYAIVGGQDQEAFTLRADSNINRVDLINEVVFDYESPKKAYHVTVRALSLNLRYELDVVVVVLDENDNKPQLDDFAIVFNNYKNHFPTTPIGRVPATDADINDQLRYRVLAGNNAQLVLVDENTGDIQLSPSLNSNVPLKAVIEVAVSDGLNDAVAQMVLNVNLVTETMLQNSVVLRLDGISREEFLTRKYDIFLNTMARILGTSNMYGSNNIVLFDVEEGLREPSTPSELVYRPYHGSSIINATLGVNISFSARADGNDKESYLSSQYIEERIYLNRPLLMHALDVYVAPFQDNLCVQEPCQNYQVCQAFYKFDKAPRPLNTSRNMIFRPIKAVQSFACSCPPTFTGMKHKSECNLQINQCFSNPCLNNGTCHRHESGYSCECKPDFIGSRCEHSFTNSTCQSIASTSLPNAPEESPLRQTTMCSGKSRCVNLSRSHFQLSKPGQSGLVSGGFTCQGCPYPQWSTDLCQLRTRSFSKNSYITLPSLRRRHRFHISLKFATIQNDAFIFYNGRYNDKHDFIALEIVDSFLRFSYSLGSAVTTVSLSSIPVSNGNWHKVSIDYNDRNVTMLLDDCDPVIDEALTRLQGSTNRRCSNTTYADSSSSLEYRMLDLTSPMLIGSLPSLPTEFQISNMNSFIGCMSDIYIDHQLVDLYNPIQDSGTQIGCPEKKNFCQQQTCNGHGCHESWGVAKCICGEDYLGRSCEILISNEKVRRFNGNSYLTFSPIESTIGPTWQVSMHFRTINPSGLLMKISLDPEASITLEMINGALKLNYRNHNMTFSKISLDDGEWHYVELTWASEFAQIQLEHNPNLSVSSSNMGSIVGSVIKTVTIGAAPNRQSEITTESQDFGTGVSNVPTEDFSSIYNYANTSSQSFVGCIFGFNISDNSEIWLTSNDERNVERGCQVADVCEPNTCPPNSRCVRKGMNQRKCICNQGFVGERCTPICELKPCQGENSQCHAIASTPESSDETQSNSYGSSYRCECEAERSGKNCQHQVFARCPSNWWGRPTAGGNVSTCGPCNCVESKGFNGDCDKTTGQCFCKINHYQPPGSDSCLPCDCYNVGSLTVSCNQTTGQCMCRSGVVGRRCDTCSSNYAEVTQRGCDVIYDACPKTYSDGIWWDKTQFDTTAKQQCPPSTSTGTAFRDCHKTEGWQKPNLFDCISNTFTDLYNQYQFFEEKKFQLTSSLAIKIAEDLRKALNETISNSYMQLYGTDMYISFRLLHHLMQHEAHQTGLNLTHRQDRMYIRNIVESINYILDPAYADNWLEIAKRSPNGGAEHLLRMIDSYGKVLIDSQSDTFTQPFEISTRYFTFGVDTLSTDQLWDLSRTSSFDNQHVSPPYATDSLVPASVQLDQVNKDETQSRYNHDGSSVFLDYSLSRDSSPAITIPKYDNYASDDQNTDETTKAVIPLKTLRVKTLQELFPNGLYQAKSRAKRAELIIPDFKLVKKQPALVAYSIYRSIGPLMPKFYDNTVQNRFGQVASVNSPVIWLTIRPANGTEFLSKNIQPKINYMLKMIEPAGRVRPQCAVWDFLAQPPAFAARNQTYGIKQTGRFTTKGCEVRGAYPNHRMRSKYEYVNCTCDHLGAVTVLMDTANYDYLAGDDTNTKDNVLAIALMISIIILTAASFILSCVRGHSIKSNSNSINKNLIIILIAFEILILYTVLSRGTLIQREYQCKLVAIFLHYLSISLFFWLLVNAIHFYRMLTELRDINHGPMKFYHVIGYAVPAFFVSIAVGLRIERFGNYLFCWLSIHDPIIWSMFGPVSFAATGTLILFLLAFCKTLPVKEDPHGADLLKNHLLINVIKTPLIAIYWLVAVYVFNEAFYFDYTYLFPTLAIVKSIALFIVLCLVDQHIRYNLYVSWLRFRGEMDSSLNYSSSQWTSQNLGEAGLKQYPYGDQVITPGFQSAYNDVPDVMAFSAASTTSRSTATGTTDSAYQYQHRSKDRDGGYGRTTRSRHRRHRKKSHHKHHHHRHHHHSHHHHHRSHRHHTDEYEHHDRYRYASQPLHEMSTQNDLASSHSSDDDVSTIPKKAFAKKGVDNQMMIDSSQNSVKDIATNEATPEQQTIPMEMPATSKSEPEAQIAIDEQSDNIKANK